MCNQGTKLRAIQSALAHGNLGVASGLERKFNSESSEVCSIGFQHLAQSGEEMAFKIPKIIPYGDE